MEQADAPREGCKRAPIFASRPRIWRETPSARSSLSMSSSSGSFSASGPPSLRGSMSGSFSMNTPAALIHQLRLMNWNVQEGDYVKANQVLGVCEKIELGSSSDPMPQQQLNRSRSSFTVRGTIHDVLAHDDGWIVELRVRPGDVFQNVEPMGAMDSCLHEVQFSGLCATCGKDLAQSPSAAAQQTFNLVHSQPQLKFSKAVAEKDARSTEERLRSERKLSLILDLDQTLVHASNDAHIESLGPFPPEPPRQNRRPRKRPRYREKEREKEKDDSDEEWTKEKEEWLRKQQEWEAKQVEKEKDMSESDKAQHQKIIEGLKKFDLPGPKKQPCEFYLKLRPHVHLFLEAVHELFELHIYTMGTRNYADKVAQLLDPENKGYFGQNIISREENPFGHEKRVQQIFPCDDRMVVVVDDRVDVWRKCKNLIKIEPYLFFHDTKVNALIPPKPEAKDSPKRKRQDATETSEGESETTTTMPEDVQTKKARIDPTEASIDGATTDSESVETVPDAAPTPLPPAVHPAVPPPLPYKPHALEDNHLLHVLHHLTQVHTMFYSSEADNTQTSTRPPQPSLPLPSHVRRLSHSDSTIFRNSWGLVQDVKCYLHLARQKVLAGVHIMFSGLFPTNEKASGTYLWTLAEEFGAVCHDGNADMNSITHLVAYQGGTQKVIKAKALGSRISIVTLKWLLDSFVTLTRQDESNYTILQRGGANSKEEKKGGISDLDQVLIRNLHAAYVEGIGLLTKAWNEIKDERVNTRMVAELRNNLETPEEMQKRMQEAIDSLGNDEGDEEEEEDDEEDDDEDEDEAEDEEERVDEEDEKVDMERDDSSSGDSDGEAGEGLIEADELEALLLGNDDS